MKTLIEVEIFGQTFIVTSEDEEKYVRALASYVEQRMRQVGESTKATVPLRVAIMAALGIADEYHKAVRREGEMKHEAEQLSAALLARLEQSERLDELAAAEHAVSVFSSEESPAPLRGEKKKETLSPS